MPRTLSWRSGSPVGIGEAKRSAYIQISETGVRERGGDELHLALDAADQLGLVAPADL
jgi:hypothetical protein